MSFVRSFLVVVLFASTAAAASIRGVVRDSAGQPLAGATVSVDVMRSAVTDARGAFELQLPEGRYRLRVARPGFQDVMRDVSTGDIVAVALQPALAETIVVAGIRAEEATPVTRTDLSRADIERLYHGQDLPLMLRDAPSITAYSEAGIGGSGYSYISLRGISPTRINFTLDGVPLSDSEDMGTYFVDLPDLSRSLGSVQIQRGVGTSTFGTAAFGGAVNLESVSLTQESHTDATLAGGSFANRQATFGWQSGALPGGINLYLRGSSLENAGYRQNSATRQRSLFFSGAKQLGDQAQLKLTGISGREWMQSSYYAADEETMRTNRRFNPLSPDEKDSFGYDLAQLQYIRSLGGVANMTASAYYQRGYGWYRLFNDARDQLREYGLDGMLLGSMLTYARTDGRLSTNFGIHVNHFTRDHTRDNLTLGRRDYANYGVKGELNAFAKASWQASHFLLFGDAQVRRATFDYHGSVDIPAIAWTFFNPKVGARYAVTPYTSVYTSLGVTTREPTRNDMFLGQDNATVAHDLRAVRPERVADFELGWNYRTPAVELEANLYAMEFHNEIAATGEQSEIGLALRKNVDQSYRRGVELQASWQARSNLRLRANGNVSRNRIAHWTQFYDVYDQQFNWLGSQRVDYRDVEPLLTPAVTVNAGADYTPVSRLTLGAVGRYVAKSYLDNTNNDAFTTPAYFMVDASLSWLFGGRARLSLQVNNVFNRKIDPSGYDYVYFMGPSLTGTRYFYPAATRNFVVTTDFRL